MPSFSIAAGPLPDRIFQIVNGGVVESEGSGTNLYSYRRSGTYLDPVRRTIPADLWNGQTAWVREEFVTKQIGLGYRKLSDSAWEVAPASRWWDGSLISSLPNIDVLSGRLRAKIKDSNLNLAQNLAEYQQTADLFSSTANDVVRTFRSLRSGRALNDIARYFRNPRSRIEKDIANRWLAYQYGMKPLLNDIYAACDALRDKMVRGQFVYVQVTDTQSSSASQKHSSTGGTCFNTWNIRLKLKARYKISEPATKQLAQVGITNPALTAWEVIPYSFVVDWLFSVGDWLASLDALSGTSDFSYYSVYKYEETCTGQTFGGGFEKTLNGYRRSSLKTDLPLPKFGYKPSTHLGNVLNGLALLRQLR